MSSAEFILIQRSLATCDHEPSTVEELIACNEKDMSGSGMRSLQTFCRDFGKIPQSPHMDSQRFVFRTECSFSGDC